jgi:hypothetical protein
MNIHNDGQEEKRLSELEVALDAKIEELIQTTHSPLLMMYRYREWHRKQKEQRNDPGT